MTNKQKIQMKQSEVRERINALLSQEERSEQEVTELRELTTKAQALETEYRAALVSEGDEESRAKGEFRDQGDGESAEIRSLFNKVTLGDYLAPASSGVGLAGQAKELNEALKVPTVGASGGVALPFDVLEIRAFMDTTSNDGSETQRPILQRLFGPGVLDALGVRLDSVPVGRTEWPLFATGVTPAQTKEATAVGGATKATFSFVTLKPKKMTGNYEYTHEMAASVGGIEQALRRDLGDAIRSKMSDIVLNGTAPDDTNPHRIEGFLSELTATDLAAAILTFADYGGLHSQGVDGIHASGETEVDSVIGVSTYKHAAAVYQAGSGESGSEVLKRRSGMCVSTSYMPDVASKKQKCVLHSAGSNGGGSMRGDSVGAVWPSIEVIRDPYSKASQGVVLTWVMLWDVKVAFRASAYKSFNLQVVA